MSKLHYEFCAGIGYVLLPSAVLAASEPEQTITTISEMLAYGSILFAVVIVCSGSDAASAADESSTKPMPVPNL